MRGATAHVQSLVSCARVSAGKSRVRGLGRHTTPATQAAKYCPAPEDLPDTRDVQQDGESHSHPAPRSDPAQRRTLPLGRSAWQHLEAAEDNLPAAPISSLAPALRPFA